jgi:ATP-dependent Clp protease, protease subunit
MNKPTKSNTKSSDDFEDEDEDEGSPPQDRRPKILKDRAILMLSGAIGEAHLGICHELLSYHFMPDFNEPITLLINSPGGSCEIGWAIIDIMNFIRLPIHTVAIGLAASMAADIFVNGDKRTVGEHATVMIHPHSSISAGSHSKLLATMKGDIIEHNRRLQHYVTNSKYHSAKEVEGNLFSIRGEDLYLTPEECVQHGLADDISFSDKKTKRKKIALNDRSKLLEKVSKSSSRGRSRKRSRKGSN